MASEAATLDSHRHIIGRNVKPIPSMRQCMCMNLQIRRPTLDNLYQHRNVCMELEVREERWQPFSYCAPQKATATRRYAWISWLRGTFCTSLRLISLPVDNFLRSYSFKQCKLGRLIQTSTVSIKTVCLEQKESR